MALLKRDLAEDAASFEVSELEGDGVEEVEGFIKLAGVFHDKGHAAGPLGLVLVIRHQGLEDGAAFAFEKFQIEIRVGDSLDFFDKVKGVLAVVDPVFIDSIHGGFGEFNPEWFVLPAKFR